MTTNDTVYERAVDLLEAELGDELVALDAEAGTCFGFNEVAASVWRELAQPKTAEALKSALLAEYDIEPEQCGRELDDLLQDLQDRGLIKSC
jgi:hypothetical protein